jgi:DNA helicase HerA-like ATPase
MIIHTKFQQVKLLSKLPEDVTDEILGQLGNRIQHALRAYTPRDLKAVRTAAETFVPNPKLDVAAVIAQLAVGEALVSTLQEKGVPSPVQRTLICPPRCRMGAITAEERLQVMGRSPVGMKYDTTVNRESAHEVLVQRAKTAGVAQGESDLAKAGTQKEGSDPVRDLLFGTKRRQGMVEAMAKSAARSVGGQIGTRIVRGILGGMTRGR